MTLHDARLLPAAPIPAQPEPATFHDLMASIGYLLFQWSLLDRSLDEEIALLRQVGGATAGGPSRPRTTNERLAEWRALLGRGRRSRTADAAIEHLGTQVQDFQRLRNLVASGFVSASSDARGPAIRCSHGAGRGAADEVRMTVPDILGAIDAMERCRAEMAMLRDPATR